MRLRRENASTRDMIVRDGIQMRYVPSDRILADPLTKSMDGTKLLKNGGQKKIYRNEMHDQGKKTERTFIKFETLSERLEKIRRENEAKRVATQSGSSTSQTWQKKNKQPARAAISKFTVVTLKYER